MRLAAAIVAFAAVAAVHAAAPADVCFVVLCAAAVLASIVRLLLVMLQLRLLLPFLLLSSETLRWAWASMPHCSACCQVYSKR